MNTEERRQAIKELLIAGNRPIKGTTLANHFSVSRQVIVQDIALLRAQGLDIMATPQGYVVTKEKNRGIIKSIVAKHHDYQDMEEELQIMLEHGARIMDVVVEHPIYGEIRANLNISYKKELDEFMRKIKGHKAEPLCSLTDGVHIHTLEMPNEESYRAMVKVLLEKGLLIVD